MKVSSTSPTLKEGFVGNEKKISTEYVPYRIEIFCIPINLNCLIWLLCLFRVYILAVFVFIAYIQYIL